MSWGALALTLLAVDPEPSEMTSLLVGMFAEDGKYLTAEAEGRGKDIRQSVSFRKRVVSQVVND